MRHLLECLKGDLCAVMFSFFRLLEVKNKFLCVALLYIMLAVTIVIGVSSCIPILREHVISGNLKTYLPQNINSRRGKGFVYYTIKWGSIVSLLYKKLDFGSNV